MGASASSAISAAKARIERLVSKSINTPPKSNKIFLIPACIGVLVFACDMGTDGIESAFDILVTTVDLVDVVDTADAIS